MRTLGVITWVRDSAQNAAAATSGRDRPARKSRIAPARRAGAWEKLAWMSRRARFRKTPLGARNSHMVSEGAAGDVKGSDLIGTWEVQ